MLENLACRLKNLNIDFTADESVKSALADKGFDSVYGARPLRRAIQNEIEDPLSERILDGSVKNGDKVLCTFKDGKFDFSV